MTPSFLPNVDFFKDRFEQFAASDLLNNLNGYSNALQALKNDLNRQAAELKKITDTFDAIRNSRKLPDKITELR